MLTIRLPLTDAVLRSFTNSNIALLNHFRGPTSLTQSVVISELEDDDHAAPQFQYKRRYSNIKPNVTEDQAINYINLLISGIPYDIATSALVSEVFVINVT